MKKKHSKKIILKPKKSIATRLLWEWLFFGTIALITIELIAFSFFFLQTGKTLEAPPVYDTDPALQQIQALHQKIQTIHNTVDVRAGNTVSAQ